MNTRIAIVFGLMLTCCLPVHGQALTEDAKGQSAILFGGNALSFDITKTSLTLNLSNFTNGKIDIEKPKMKLYGVSLNGSNGSGISTLFSAGKVQPSVNIRGFIGVQLIRPKELYGSLVNQDNLMNTVDDKAFFVLRKQYIQGAEKLIKAAKLSNDHRGRLKYKIDTVRIGTKPQSSYLPSYIVDQLKKFSPDSTFSNDSMVVRHVTNTLLAVIDSINTVNNVFAYGGLEDRLRQQYADLKIARENVKDVIDKGVSHKSLTLYLAGGLNTTSFQQYDSKATGAFDNRFSTTSFQGISIDAGVNYKWGANYFLGASLGYERASTLAQLTATDYTVRMTDTLRDQQLVSEQKYTGYTGDYRLYNLINFRIDAIRFSQIGGKESDFRLAWNMLYSRWSISDNTTAAKSQLALGTSLNFFNIKSGGFLGGVYIQANDITNEQRAATTALGRLTFGLVAKYAFSTILSEQVKN